jgi:hypothetical protein
MREDVEPTQRKSTLLLELGVEGGDESGMCPQKEGPGAVALVGEALHVAIISAGCARNDVAADGP